ncbi:GPI-anchored surface protein, putative [Bodo saltans]|uniref:GPI-anchored surface protein, putative n=1 Tax=Bodo saltans TaxID=75058 RepID=A0A0S4J3Y8_BODSA|nr:GPI-anchored surface protein, putative [Bodo saltans]|eukprot:CUG72443.1 GPI-anchored surface protein, putative [Bodo saltans]
MDNESVRLAAMMVYRIASSSDEAAALFAVECVREALVAMSTHASTSSAVRWVSHAVTLHAVTSRSTNCVKELFGTVAVRDALVRLSHQAMTPCAVEAVSLALSDLIFCGAAHEELFLSKCVRNGLLSMVVSATTQQSIERLAEAFLNCIFLSRVKRFLCVRVRDALLAMCARTTTGECVLQVADTLISFGAVNYPLVSRIVTTCEVRDAVVMLASRATNSKCAGFVASAFEAVLRADWDTGAPEMFGTSSVHEALIGLATRVTEPLDVGSVS